LHVAGLLEPMEREKRFSLLLSRLLFPLRNKGCGYLEKFAQGSVPESAPELVTIGPKVSSESSS